MALLSDFNAWAPWLLGLIVAGIVLGNFRLRAMILCACIAVGLCDGIAVNVLKHKVGRPRPSQVEPGVRMVQLGVPPSPFPRVLGVITPPVISYPHGIKPPEEPGVLIPDHPTQGHSFPSGHAANNMAVTTVLILFYRRGGWFYLPIALMIGYSRIYTGAHWPSDVLAGFFLGVVGGWFAVLLMREAWRRWGLALVPRLASTHPSLLS